ncbi:hypothetical protein LF145_05830 [Limosilactobacillus frumenti]|nr:hypothetical protein LF145_05830 [Limosilactobacillus frumenti]
MFKLSIIPTVDVKSASQEAKNYLKSFEDWNLIYSRRKISNLANPIEHQQAKYELVERRTVVSAVNQIDPSSAIILECRFIKKYSTQKTIEQLARHDITITVGNFYHRQRKALLLAYEFMPKSHTKIVK